MNNPPNGPFKWGGGEFYKMFFYIYFQYWAIPEKKQTEGC